MRIDRFSKIPGRGWVAIIFFNGEEAKDHHGRIEVADEEAGYMDVEANLIIHDPLFHEPHLLVHRLWGKVEIKLHNWMEQGSIRGDVHPF